MAIAKNCRPVKKSCYTDFESSKCPLSDGLHNFKSALNFKIDVKAKFSENHSAVIHEIFTNICCVVLFSIINVGLM